MDERILGADISLAHGAFVLLVNNRVADFQFVSDRKKVCDKGKKAGTFLPSVRIEDKQQRDTVRLAFWGAYLKSLISSMRPSHAGVEDYAYRATQSAYHLGEIGGLLKVNLYMAGVLLRLHDPASLKMFAAHHGTLDSKETMAAILERWPEAREFFEKFTSGADARTVEDLCDAYALAKLVKLELDIRKGKRRLDELPPKELTVFNRCTKRYQVSLLARDWIGLEVE
jgi:Holliday junction resolvasome RuvABC endonuclease subunit